MPEQETEQPIGAEESEENSENKEQKSKKKKSGWFAKIPKDVFFSPTGMILFILAAAIEIIDLIPIPIADQIWELPLELMFIAFAVMLIEEITLKSMLIFFLLERIPWFNDICPTFLIGWIKMIM